MKIYKKAKIIIGVILIIIIIGVVIVKACLSIKKNKAIVVAQEYLAERYTQEMQYKSVRFPWIDPAIYHVYFSPTDNPDLKFEVMVQMDLTLSESRIVGNRQYMPDNYYTAYFGQQMANHFIGSVRDVWGNDASTYVIAPNPALYAFGVPLGLNDQMPLRDMESLIEEYLIYINTEQFLNDDNMLDEAEKMLAFILLIQNSEYEPDDIVFRYLAPKTSTYDGLMIIGVNNWQDISTVDQIIKQIKK